MFPLKILCVSLLFGISKSGLVYQEYLDFDDVGSDYDDYNGNITQPIANESGNRIKRYEAKSPVIKVLSPKEIREVKGALSQILGGIDPDNPFTSDSATETTTYLTETMNDSITITDFDLSMLNVKETVDKVVVTTIKYPTNTEIAISTYPTKSYKLFERKLTTEDHFKNATNVPRRTTPKSKPIRTRQRNKTEISFKPLDIFENRTAILREGTTITTVTSQTTITTVTSQTTITTENSTNLETTTATRSTKSRELDMPRLLSIIADLAEEFESNLTRKLNETLFNMSIPTCTTPTEEPTVTSDYDANYTGVTVAKCFVCGLDIPRIPHHAHCADAFAGDFLPLVPVDPTAKGRISTYRKYCKYSNVRGYTFNETHPRAIYGRWTGGCAVRWIDLSGIYTQRTCRNRLQPMLGKHFASKRMAKLERSLWNIDNGCIVSPMATLVPLSRGVSLYARFHACVCTGNWCNIAIVAQPWIMCHLIMLAIVIIRNKI